MDNKEFSESISHVKTFASRTFLYEPERTVLEILKSKLGTMRMLDIGVGGGRTTIHFANLVKEYVGIDYSRAMIAECNKKFAGKFKNVSFQVLDARSMQIFHDNSFDFILFGFNGLDYVSHEDRLIALKEIKRICRPGGYFLFSTHNLFFVDELFRFKVTTQPKKILHNTYRYIKLRKVNEDYHLFKSLPYAFIYDGPGNYKFLNYYITPEEQLKQLKAAGFLNTKIYLNSNGEEYTNSNQQLKKEPWLYYLCEA